MPGTTVVQQGHHIPSGYLNSANDPVPGQPIASPSGSIVQGYGGQLGGKIVLDDNQAAAMSNPTGTTLLQGVYQYVRFRSADAAFVLGQVCFWDITVASNLYQVTINETLASSFPGIAGIVLNAVTPGNYGYIQVLGRATVLFRTVALSFPGALGVPCVWAALGAGADNATADTIGGAGGATITEVAQMQQRRLGDAEAIPVAGAASVVRLIEPWKRF